MLGAPHRVSAAENENLSLVQGALAFHSMETGAWVTEHGFYAHFAPVA